jgi:hypothetical protein
VELLKNKFGIPTYLSDDIPERLALPTGAYDYGFAMSLFSHLPHISFARWIQARCFRLRIRMGV